MIGNLCCLLVGFMLGGVTLFRWWVLLHRKPDAVGILISNALRSCSATCGRSRLHFVDVTGAPVQLAIPEICRTLEVELETWITQGLPHAPPWDPPDGFA